MPAIRGDLSFLQQFGQRVSQPRERNVPCTAQTAIPAFVFRSYVHDYRIALVQPHQQFSRGDRLKLVARGITP